MCINCNTSIMSNSNTSIYQHYKYCYFNKVMLCMQDSRIVLLQKFLNTSTITITNYTYKLQLQFTLKNYNLQLQIQFTNYNYHYKLHLQNYIQQLKLQITTSRQQHGRRQRGGWKLICTYDVCPKCKCRHFLPTHKSIDRARCHRPSRTPKTEQLR